MSDQNKFINTYVDKAVGMLHEYISMVIQLRTQLHVANDLIQEKDQVISSLKEVDEKNKFDQNELEQARNQARSWEEQYNAMKGKVSHMDTFANQINDMKQALLAKNAECDELRRNVETLNISLANKDNEMNTFRNEIDNLKNSLSETEKLIPKETPPKKAINTKSKSKPIVIESEKPIEETDDF